MWFGKGVVYLFHTWKCSGVTPGSTQRNYSWGELRSFIGCWALNPAQPHLRQVSYTLYYCSSPFVFVWYWGQRCSFNNFRDWNMNINENPCSYILKYLKVYIKTINVLKKFCSKAFPWQIQLHMHLKAQVKIYNYFLRVWGHNQWWDAGIRARVHCHSVQSSPPVLWPSLKFLCCTHFTMQVCIW